MHLQYTHTLTLDLVTLTFDLSTIIPYISPHMESDRSNISNTFKNCTTTHSTITINTVL